MSKTNFILKNKAIKLRKQGYGIREIERALNIPRSTLSGWLKSTPLTKAQKTALYKRWEGRLEKARKKAAKTNRAARKARIKKIEKEAQLFLDSFKFKQNILELFLASLYLGDGFKTGGRTALGSTNPEVLKGFVTLLRNLYNIDEKRLRASIYARADQDVEELKTYWSRLLKIPKKQFYKSQIDKRTKGRKTYPSYKGVCSVYYFDSNIQRRLIAISKEFLGRVAQLV